MGYKKAADGCATKGKTKAKMMAGGGMPMVEKGGKKVPAFAADGKGKMAMGGKVKMMGGGAVAMNVGGKAHSDMAKDKPMMKKVAKAAVKGHEKRMHRGRG